MKTHTPNKQNDFNTVINLPTKNTYQKTKRVTGGRRKLGKINKKKLFKEEV